MVKVAYDEKVSAEAGAWLARLHSDRLSLREEAAFQDWIAADPAHAAAFEDATGIWDRLGAVPKSCFVNEAETPRLDRRLFITAAASLAIAGGAAPFFLGTAKAQIYRTAVGEQKHISLPDGTKILLDTDTCVSMRFNSDVRLLDLIQGRMNCHVAQNQRQFAVKAAERLVVGNESVFDLSNFNDRFSVFLIEGNATVRSGNDSVTLGEGERAFASSKSSLRCDRPGYSSTTAWQTGRLVFKNDLISEAARQMNRYSSVKLEVNEPTLAAKRISGGYRAGDNIGFAESLAHLLPIEVIRNGNKIQLTSKS